ncbi:formylglycine-generating enzyme family protein [Candidatus Uabimicrobium sp. HlEnr_7]|uniref:formylglycine-generating enzyme family protein n=1 Tax=Candidatus Uabimicrobium helgolandensis TaxID=3095367 RepID=UPI003556D6FA
MFSQQKKSKTLMFIESNTKYLGCTFVGGKEQNRIIENCGFENCSFRGQTYLDEINRCQFKQCNFSSLIIDKVHSTVFESGYIENLCAVQEIIKQIEKFVKIGTINSAQMDEDVWRECWQGSFFDFNQDAWQNLSHDKQQQYAKAYRNWYSNVYQLNTIKEYSWANVQFNLQLIPPGKFEMGELNREQSNRPIVTLPEPYWLAETTCTQELWEIVMSKNPSSFKGKNRPAERVNWMDCRNFLKKIDLDLRFPTEAEWEYACRAGTSANFSFGSDENHKEINIETYKMRQTIDVKTLPPNNWEMYEMHSNVHEWCSDWFDDLPSGEYLNPKGSKNVGKHVLRGHSWDSWCSWRKITHRFRSGELTYHSASAIGFRFAQTIYPI